ncbi:MAG: hypothetical protein HYR91_05665 [Flavobacteriia bacterium]|nr:hypothetical protein [Flavobacteriia bacterium]
MIVNFRWGILIYGMLLSDIAYSQTDSLACISSCHCFRNLTPAGVMISHIHPKKEWMFSYRLMEMKANNFISGNKSMNEMDVFNEYIMSTDKMNMNMHMFMVMYGISNRLTVMTMLNYSVNQMSMKMIPTDMQEMAGMDMNNPSKSLMNSSGLGDSKLYFLYGIIKKIKRQLVLGIGANIPTGSISVKGLNSDMLYPNKRLPYMMQLGTGTIDFLPSITYFQQSKDWGIGIQGSSVFRWYFNTFGYHNNNEHQVNIWGATSIWNNISGSFRIEGKILKQLKGADKTIYRYNEIYANPLNYGGLFVIGYIGLAYQFPSGLMNNTRVNLEYGLPLYQNVNGIQNKQKRIIQASLSYLF